jgi:hypothetical protein
MPAACRSDGKGVLEQDVKSLSEHSCGLNLQTCKNRQFLHVICRRQQNAHHVEALRACCKLSLQGGSAPKLKFNSSSSVRRTEVLATSRPS